MTQYIINIWGKELWFLNKPNKSFHWRRKKWIVIIENTIFLIVEQSSPPIGTSGWVMFGIHCASRWSSSLSFTKSSSKAISPSFKFFPEFIMWQFQGIYLKNARAGKHTHRGRKAIWVKIYGKSNHLVQLVFGVQTVLIFLSSCWPLHFCLHEASQLPAICKKQIS